MKKTLWLICCISSLWCTQVAAQGIHFSQYYNAPLFLNPANTALLPEYDYRVGLNYRNQWAALPVPYNTFSAFGDFKLGGNANNTRHNNWLGVGFAFFSDKAGDGNLALTGVQGTIAYHLQLSEFTMLSAGIGASSVLRSVNYDNLTFDAQWDGFSFNPRLASGDQLGIIKTSYRSFTPGLNFAWFPNEAVYMKLGASVANINRPRESFYKTGTNVLDYRPMGNLDIVLQTSDVLIVNPSVYYTQMNGAQELVGGAQFRTRLSDKDQTPAQLILGAYMRLGDAAIGVAGLQIGPVQFMANYDFTLSSLAPYNASYGALEFSLIYQSSYHPGESNRKGYSCPRFF